MNTKFDPEAGYILEDEWVLLRPLQTSDFENLLPFAINEPDTWNYSLVSAKGPEGMRGYMEAALNGRKGGKEYPFIVYDKKTTQYAGCTRFYDIQPDFETMQLGYTWYGEKYRGTGLNKHCKFLLLQFAFETLNMKRIEFRADARNDRSIAAMKSIGCKVEGVLRSHTPIENGTRRDSIILSILQHEWLQEVKARLKAKL